MTIEQISNDNWVQTHQGIAITSMAGEITINSCVPNGTIDCMAGMYVNLKSAKSRINITSNEQETEAPSTSGQIEIVAGGALPIVMISTVPEDDAVTGSSLTLTGSSVEVTTGIPGESAGLQLSPQGASLSASAETLKSGINITPYGIVIQVGETTITITANGVMMTCGDSSFNLTASSIVESVTPASTRALSSTGHTLVGAELNQIISAETRMVIAPSGVTTTAATKGDDVDATVELMAAGVSELIDAEKETTSSINTTI
jgi:hypothetical protein